MNLFIDYFTSEERNRKIYRDAVTLIKQIDLHFPVDNRDDFFNVINRRDLTSINHITILTHGVDNSDYICKDGQLINAISYLELAHSLNSTINGIDVKLNLVGICESFEIKPFVRYLNTRFSEIWISKVKSPSLSAPIIMVYEGFDYLIYDKDEEDIIYEKILNPL